MKVAYIEAHWHYNIVENARKGFSKALNTYNFWEPVEMEYFSAPWSLEIPILCQKLIDTGEFDHIVWVGFVVDGGIYEHKFVWHAILQNLVRISSESKIPIFSVILTPQDFDDTPEDNEKFEKHFIEKWEEAGRALIHMYETCEQIKKL